MANLFKVKTVEEAEQIVMLAFHAHIDLFDGMEPELLDENLDGDFYEGSLEAISRVIAFALAETPACDEGLGIGDVVTMIERDMKSTTRLVVTKDYHNADTICAAAAKRLIRIFRGEEKFRG